ncbi:MAG: penicillin acylase family protein, partial [Actinoallomurus sp.]
LDLLLNWDGELAADSAAAALFEVWYRRHLRPALLDAALAPLVPPDERALTLARVLPAEELGTDARVDLDLLLTPGDRLGPDPYGTLRRIVQATLAGAMAEVEGLLGPDTGKWAWGRLHQAEPRHPLAGRLGGRDWTSTGPVPRGGSGDTVGSTAYTPDFRQLAGATFRLVIDVGSWDDSVAMNAPGQSGVPSSPHHHDLFASWSADEAFPLLYSREAVEKALAERIILIRK